MITRTLLLSAACVLAVAVPASASAPAVFSGATGGSHTRPSTLALTADGTLEVGNVTWSSWGGAVARGTGTASYHGCTPSCAAGKSHSARVTIRLSDPVVCGPRRYYNRVQLRLPSGALLDRAYLGPQSWAPCAHRG